ncbi:phosphoribosylamine--glycine ligase [Blattabacterium cuenoti]|uniref:phosphoribosylamine--glycine ligase n=1 Tax=Blattabacterium cuenoti TaxID=1653831 RepID=UPI00163C8553|nr:phosphoribosylamine--glycine ligase [Blattabacterium cuenoti]
MKFLIIGNGGREHAIGKKLLEDDPFVKIYFYPGNGGTDLIGNNVKKYSSILELVVFVKKNKIDITIVGSEIFLMQKIVDIFHHYKLKIIGPHYLAAKLEGDRIFSKSFMNKYGIRTPKHQIFHNYHEAVKFLEDNNDSFAIKTNGIAYGKGVILTHNKKETKEALKMIMVKKKFGKSGDKVIIEEFLNGKEVSIISFFDGKNIIPFLSSKDYKKIGDNDIGLNTGGMGCIAPNPHMNHSIWMDFKKNILIPTLEGLILEKLNFFGFLYFGLMITSNKIYLLEYNTRFGDPEAQTLLPLLMKNNFLHMIKSPFQGKTVHLHWKNYCSCCIVISSKGYPEKYDIGKKIMGIEKLKEPFFISGARREKNTWYTTSGRVLNILGIGNSIQEARYLAYQKIKQIQFENYYFRKDIGL